MLFASGLFLYWFLPAFLALYYLTPARWRSLTLALASYVFYGWWRPDFVLLMWFSTILDFTCGKRIERARSRGERGKPWLLLSITLNLGLLGYFKYANFGIESLNILLEGLGYSNIRWTEVILPVGISFYTFQTLSYTVDVYRGQAPPVRTLRDFMCYVAMFPQLVAGPIVRYNLVAEQLHSRTHTWDKFGRGVLAFQAGLAKKILIADLLAEVADQAFAANSLGVADSWIGSLAYTLQIYFDFSGYSDMAIGLGLMMGFQLPINFNRPYASVSITDFWRRWHISLSEFLRDYLYIPLGGNQKGKRRTYINLALTMLIGGLWHGAAWTFVAWGAYQGFWLILERLSGKRSLFDWLPGAGGRLLTFALVIFGWVLFRAGSLGAAGARWGEMLGLGQDAEPLLLIRPMHMIAAGLALAILWLTPTTQRLIKNPPVLWMLAMQPIFLLSLIQLHYQDHVPFLYFQF